MVQAVIEQLLSLPEDIHEQLRAGVTQYLGRMSRWISYNGAALQPIMQFLLQSVEKRAVIVATTVTLKQIAFECADIMAPHFEVLVQVMQAAPELNLYESESKCGDDFLDVVAVRLLTFVNTPLQARKLLRYYPSGLFWYLPLTCITALYAVGTNRQLRVSWAGSMLLASLLQWKLCACRRLKRSTWHSVRCRWSFRTLPWRRYRTSSEM